MHLILGSNSPRRREILGYFSFPFEVVAPSFDEESHEYRGDPVAYASELAMHKAASLAARFPEELILTADTVVYSEGKIYNKPANHKEAAQFLRELSGKWHEVITGLCLQKGDWQKSGFAKTRILFCPLSESQIDQYIKQVHPFDKAGGYAIQRAGSIIVAKIEGCHYNVMGLPIQALRELLLCAGIDLWVYLKSS